MNRTAKQLGMNRSTFKNAYGLTESGHLTTTQDMAVLFRALHDDFPDYFNLFQRKTTSAGVRTNKSSARRLLNSDDDNSRSENWIYSCFGLQCRCL